MHAHRSRSKSNPRSPTAEFSPGLTLTPKATTISLTEDLSTCTGISDPPVTSLFAEFTATIPAGCLDPLNGLAVSLELVYTWNTGDTSTFQLTATVTRAGAVEIVTGIGEITDGLFEGVSAVLVQTLPVPSVLHCLAPGGVTELSGPALATITLVQ